MSNKILFVSFITFMVCASFKPLNTKDLEQFTYVNFKTPELQIKYMREGLLCSGSYKKTYHIDFIRKIPLAKVMALQSYITRANIWSMSSSYEKIDRIIDGDYSKIFILNREQNDEYKNISYYNCYNPVLDSLMVYLNDLIPANKRKYYDINKYRYNKDMGNCVIH